MALMNTLKPLTRLSSPFAPKIRSYRIKECSPFKRPRRVDPDVVIDVESSNIDTKPRHLICFKQWTADMVLAIINGAIRLKKCCPDTHGTKLPTLNGAKIMILQEVNQPVLHMAVSKAASMLGADDVSIIDHVVWEQDYMGRIFSQMADAIFVSTSTHMCVQRFADQSLVPVMCMHSRTHASIQAMATVMCIIEEFWGINGIKLGYLGPAHPILNSLLLLCPMLKADIKYKCCCDKIPVSPLLHKASEEMSASAHTEMKACNCKEDVFTGSQVIVAGPTTTKKEKLQNFKMSVTDISEGKKEKRWIFIHVCPRGEEVDDTLFYHCHARTYNVFENMQYIAAALMTNAILGQGFLQ